MRVKTILPDQVGTARSKASRWPAYLRLPWLRSLAGKLRGPSVSITLKWSLSISALIVMGMGLLGSTLLAQQERNYLRQMEAFGHAMVEQLAFAAAEPMMADDAFSLNVMASREAQSERVLGVGIYRQGEPVTEAGLSPFAEQGVNSPPPASIFGDAPFQFRWSMRQGSTPTRKALSFVAPIQFEDVIAGHALVTLDRDIMDEGFKQVAKAIAIATLILIALTVTMAFALGRRLSRPIQDLAAAGEAMGKGGLDRLETHRRRDEIGSIMDTFNYMADGLLEKERVEAALSRYISPNVAKSILANPEQATLGGQPIEGSVLFCDIVGFTQLSESLPPTEVAALLNEYFGYIAVAGHSCAGTVDKFIGDCVMVVFGAPDPDLHHGLHAVTCAVLIQEIVRHLNKRRVAVSKSPVYFRIGVNSGAMLAGNMGAPERMQFTVVGDTVNLASRLCSGAAVGQTLISCQTAEQPRVREQVRLVQQPPMAIRGRRQPVDPISVEGLNGIYRKRVQQALERILPSASGL